MGFATSAHLPGSSGICVHDASCRLGVLPDPLLHDALIYALTFTNPADGIIYVRDEALRVD